MKYLQRGLMFGWFMFIVGGIVADIGELQCATSYYFTGWKAFSLIVFVVSLLGIGFFAGLESGENK